MVKCRHNPKLILAYVMGELPKAASQQVRQNIEKCSACSAEYRKISNLLQDMSNAKESPKVIAGDDFVFQLRERIESKQARKWNFFPNWNRWIWPVATATTCILVFMILHSDPKPKRLAAQSTSYLPRSPQVVTRPKQQLPTMAQLNQGFMSNTGVSGMLGQMPRLPAKPELKIRIKLLPFLTSS